MYVSQSDSLLPEHLGASTDSVDERIVPCRSERLEKVAFFRDVEEVERAARDVMAEMGITKGSVRRVLDRLFADALVFPDADDRQTLTCLIVEELTDPAD